MPTTRTAISLPTSELRAADNLAVRESVTRSELIRKALRSYRLNKSLDRIRSYGERSATLVGADSYDDIERIAG